MKVFFLLYSLLHLDMILVLICLSPQRMHRRTLCSIEHPALYESLIDIYSHLAAERVDLPHQVTLARAAYRRIARHHSNSLQVYGKHQRFLPHPGSSKPGFTACMACADNDHIISSHQKFFHYLIYASIFL